MMEQTALGVTRVELATGHKETELVVVERHEDVTTLVTEDGTRLVFDAIEFWEAVGPVSDRPFWHGLRDRAA